VGELEADVRRLMDQNILLTSENTALKTDKSGLQNSGAHLSREIEEMKKYIQSLEREIVLAKHKEGSTVSTIT
jgi:predicted nucleic acid-binding protein